MSNNCLPYHIHDDRYYNKELMDKKLAAILLDASANKVLLGSGIPPNLIGDNGDIYIDIISIRSPVYRKIANRWVFQANLNEIDTEILETTQEV